MGDDDLFVFVVCWCFGDGSMLMIVLNFGFYDVMLFDLLVGKIVFEMLLCVCDWLLGGYVLLCVCFVWCDGVVN